MNEKIEKIIRSAIACSCGGTLEPDVTDDFNLENVIPGKNSSFLKKVTAEVSGAPCMVCRKCGNTHLAEETKEELLDVLTLSVALSWRRLYPEDVYFVRSRMGLKKTEFERIAGVDEKNLTISGFKGKKPEENEFMIRIEDHPVYISDQISDNIKKLALGLVNIKTRKLLENKWFFQTITSGAHLLTTRKKMDAIMSGIESAIQRLKDSKNSAGETP